MSTASVPAAEPALAERRAVKEYQDGRFPAQLKAVQDAAGFAVPVEVEWNALAVAGESANYGKPEYYEWTIFGPLAAALRDVTRDATGLDALKAKLKKIVVTYDPATAPASNYAGGVSFSDGTLRVNFQPWVNSDGEGGENYKARTQAIRQALEKAL